jgi:glycosyltransferase involved in cell wall biosynthesis
MGVVVATRSGRRRATQGSSARYLSVHHPAPPAGSGVDRFGAVAYTAPSPVRGDHPGGIATRRAGDPGEDGTRTPKGEPDLQRGLTISVVIPAYNEEQGIQEVIRRLPGCVDEIVVANNNSTDRTAELAAALGAKVVLETRQGYGAAYKRGLGAASKDVVVTMDADGTYPPEAVPGLVDRLIDEQLDFISAARFPLKDPRAMNFSNKVGNWILTSAVWVLFGRRMVDSQSGMWVFRREVLGKLRLESDGMPFSQEIKIEASRHPEVRFAERHIAYEPRIGEVKLRKWRDGWGNLTHLVRKRFS